jgi:NADH-quinone oxidoreductase subunit L
MPSELAFFAWAILLSPLAAGVLILLAGIRRPKLSAAAAIAGLFFAFLCTARLFLHAQHHHDALPFEANVAWIALPGLAIPFGVLIDPLSLLMTLIVTGIGTLIFIYAAGYMADDPGFSRFYGILSLFAFSMLTIVLSTNWIQLFIGWELVGFSSYLLIGHWYAKPSAAEAGKKAFMVNRVADFGFLLGILALWSVSGASAADRTFHFLTLEGQLPGLIQAGFISGGTLTVIGLLLFCGPLGKSAQFPLHVWLPDAMEGPTPVSALIHAATMVAAGVYLLCRAFWLFSGLPDVMTVIMWVGTATALLSACLALVESDLKRILAYSTLSQLGYMVMAVGLGGRVEAMYHLSTHAFFKALLFLSAGSVMHATHELNIWKLGGLRHSMKWTSLCFLIGALSLSGIPGLSGFFSKDEILALAKHRQLGVYVLATLTAGLTAFYTARAWFVAFTGASRLEQSRGKSHAARGGRGSHGVHESPPIMLIPLFILAALSIVGGYLGLPHLLGAEHAAFHWDVAITSTVVALGGIGIAYLIYHRRAVSPDQVVQALALPYSFLQRRYWIDEMYSWYVTEVQQKLIAGACLWIERSVIINVAVNGIAWLTKGAGLVLRRSQTGKIQTYVFVFLVGVAGLLLAAILRRAP